MGVNPADDKKVSAAVSEQEPVQPSLQMASRRRMLRRSVGVAAPAVLTLASNPVSACNCIQASTFASQVALSSRMPSNAGCTGGKTPSQWAAIDCTTNSWPSSCKDTTTTDRSKKLSAVFGSDALSYWACGFTTSTTLKQALSCSNSVAKDIVAAYLSASMSHYVTSSNGVTILSTSEVYKMWRALALNAGRYTPTGTTFNWNSSQAQQWVQYMR